MEALAWLEGTWPAEFVRQTPWVYASLEIVHLLGLALLVGPAALFDLRLLGAGRRAISVSAAARRLLPVARAGFAAAAVSGAAMFAAGAREIAGAGAAPVKLALLGVAGVNVALFHLGVYRRVGAWDGDLRPPVAARVAGGVSLGAWAGVVAAGRLIAYT
ncbi:hypothetical protein [Bailinhaonella thermotolerans]|uniref:DUF2214 domain-containing protein n=1 Tax=Bailinhaonella thermotolerans TaxID=1070861 RepID=A0A3A4BBR2_9ACTN|nr:hypothetical protein [Bailinhaonella thermotolerans]RJL35536.1 hypothetical protein D5H75_01685 [Bailinhaonella thermotolerans]